MNGKSLLLDTNAVVALLQGNQQLLQLTREAGWIGISIISQIEFLCFTGLTDTDRNLFLEFLAKVEVVGLHADDHDFVGKAVEIRRTFPVKLPDAIIAATALIKNASLVTADRQLETIKNLPIVSF
jgi:hypothetical protein